MGFLRDTTMRTAAAPVPDACRDGKSYPARDGWTAFTTLFCASLLSACLALTGCGRADGDYGFNIESVALEPAHQRIDVTFTQALKLSGDAREALDHGVPLTVRIEMELRDSMTLTLLADDFKRFEIRYLPLSQRYELSLPGDGEARNYPRLRHVLNALSSVHLTLATGALAPGSYEFRTRVRLESGRLPAPMRLPAIFSGQWQHDSEWSTWPFDISV